MNHEIVTIQFGKYVLKTTLCILIKSFSWHNSGNKFLGGAPYEAIYCV